MGVKHNFKQYLNHIMKVISIIEGHPRIPPTLQVLQKRIYDTPSWRRESNNSITIELLGADDRGHENPFVEQK